MARPRRSPAQGPNTGSTPTSDAAAAEPVEDRPPADESRPAPRSDSTAPERESAEPVGTIPATPPEPGPDPEPEPAAESDPKPDPIRAGGYINRHDGAGWVPDMESEFDPAPEAPEAGEGGLPGNPAHQSAWGSVPTQDEPT